MIASLSAATVLVAAGNHQGDPCSCRPGRAATSFNVGSHELDYAPLTSEKLFVRRCLRSWEQHSADQQLGRLADYISQIFMGGQQSVVTHNICVDSLVASPLILDLGIVTELMQRIEVSIDGGESSGPTRHVLSILTYLSKSTDRSPSTSTLPSIVDLAGHR